WSFTILNLDQHSGKECHQHHRYRQYPRNWESQLEVLAHLRAGQSKREPQCWGERRDEGADDVADNQCCSSTEAGDVISRHFFQHARFIDHAQDPCGRQDNTSDGQCIRRVTFEGFRLIAGRFEVNDEGTRCRDEEGRCWWQQSGEQAHQHGQRHHDVDDGDNAALAEVVAVFFLHLFLACLEISSQRCDVNFGGALEFSRCLKLCYATLF